MLRNSSIFVISLLIAVSAVGQSGTLWRTSADVREGSRGSVVGTVTDVDDSRNRFRLTPDDDRYGQISVEADAVSTQCNGFGGTINGSPEIFLGSTGFANLRVSDRVEVRGVGRVPGVVAANSVRLVGRNVPAEQVGVGQTRPPSSVSTPVPGRIEGIVRQVNTAEGRLVIETDRREMITVRATIATPVYYRGDVYKISNLDAGDRVRIEPESATGSGNEMRARVIDVIQSVQDSGGTTSRQVGSLTGRVTNVDRRNEVVRVDTGRGEVRVDLSSAVDSSGRRVRASDMQVGDRVELSGSSSGDLFVATTVRFDDDATTSRPPTPTGTQPSGLALGAVTIYGTVSQSLNNGPQLIIRDTQNNQTIRLYALEDLPVRTRSGGYTTADRLKEGDSVVVKAYRDADGNYIAQTIRQR